MVAVCRSRISGEGGQNLIEFAFLLPIILVFALVIFDLGLAVDRREVIQHAVREGTRTGAVGASVAEIKDVTVAQSDGLLAPADISVCYVDGPDSGSTPGNAGDSVRVSASYTYQFTVGSGELLTVFSVDPNSLDIDMEPSAESGLETSVPGAVAC